MARKSFIRDREIFPVNGDDVCCRLLLCACHTCMHVNVRRVYVPDFRLALPTCAERKGDKANQCEEDFEPSSREMTFAAVCLTPACM